MTTAQTVKARRISTNPLRDFVDEAGKYMPSSSYARSASERALAILRAAGVDPDLARDLGGLLIAARQLVDELALRRSGYSVLTDYRSGSSICGQLAAQLSALVAELECFTPAFGRLVEHETTYTAKQLKEIGQIRKSTWQSILRASYLERTPSGDHGREFTLSMIRHLIDVARRMTKAPKAQQAARLWARHLCIRISAEPT